MEASAQARPGANRVDEWGEESFPASDPPTGWKGPEEYDVAAGAPRRGGDR